MNVFFDMVGCRLNQAEIDLFAIQCASNGDHIVQSAKDADLIYVNTCCVTKKAAADSRKMIRRYQRETEAKVIAMGCWPSAMTEEVQQIVDENLIITNDEKFQLLNYDNINFPDLHEKPHLGDRHRTRAFVKIQEGCRNQCTYCLTTIARGKLKSCSEESIVHYINSLEQIGLKEIVLTGVQLGSWGKDFDRPQRLHQLLQTILSSTSIPRIRLSSIEPWDVDDNLLGLFSNKRLCDHLHIPIQSGSDSVLKSMRRPSNSSELKKLFHAIHTQLPGLSITSDFIVGFPAESDQDFQDSLQLIQDLEITGGHVFTFSPMPGTLAANEPGQIQSACSKERSRQMRKLLAEQNVKYITKRLNSSDEALIESALRIDDVCYWRGLSRDMLRIYIKSDENLRNKIIGIKLINQDSLGRIIAYPEEASNLQTS